MGTSSLNIRHPLVVLVEQRAVLDALLVRVSERPHALALRLAEHAVDCVDTYSDALEVSAWH